MSDEDAPTFTPPHPAIPSRKQATDAPRFDLAAQVATLGADSLLPQPPKRRKAVKKATKVQVRAMKTMVRLTPHAKIKNPSRSAAATQAWKTRRARLGNASPASRDELGVLVQMMTLMERLPAGKRPAVLKILQGLVS